MKALRSPRWSEPLYRVLLRAYPREFRARFASDMAEDFAAMLRDWGRWRAWRLSAVDLAQSMPHAHADARRRRARASAFSHQKEGPMSSLLFDLRHAARMLLKAPVFTAITLTTLALGIGANSATFSLVNAALLRPLGFHDPDRLLLVYEGIPQANLPKIPVSPPDFLDLKQSQRSFTGIAAYRSGTIELAGSGEPQRIDIARSSAALFPLLGVGPLLGRTFTSGEDTPGHDVVVLGYNLWQRMFAGRPDVIGQTVRLDRRPFEVIGVMPASFEFPKRGPLFNATPADAWIPIAFTDAEKTTRGVSFNNSVVGRLKDGVSFEQATTELKVLAPRVRENYPIEIKNSLRRLEVSAVALPDEIAGQIRTPLLVLFAAVALVLLVVCANVANLILSRAASRQRELGVRLALGATRARLLQLLLCESLLLSLAGGALGLTLAGLVLYALPSVIATSLPGLNDVSLDARVVAFTLGISMLTAIAFGLAPLYSADRDVASRLHDGGSRTTAGGRGQRLQHTLVTGTVTLAVVLLVGAGLLVRSFTALVATEPGFQPDQVLTLTVEMPREAYGSGDSIVSFAHAVSERMRSVAGLRAVSISTDVPFETSERRGMTPEIGADNGTGPAVAVTWTLGDYFRALGVPLKRGRSFTPDEDRQNRAVAIVSESLANRYWPGQDAIGKRIKWGVAASHTPWNTIVGVVGDVKDVGLRDDPTIHVYVPLGQLAPEIDDQPPASGFGRLLRIALLAGADPSTLVAPGRQAIAAIDASLPVTRIAMMTRQLEDSIAPQRFSTIVLAAFALGALLLAAVGLYGIVAFAVAQRTREIGLRIALGATSADVLGMVLRQGMHLVIVGLGLGVAGAAALTRAMSALLYRTEPFDPWTFVVAPLVLTAVALLACYLPARRAARIEPLTALRTE
jgi:predicted permease